MNYTTLALAPVSMSEPDIASMHSLYQALQELPDPRRQQGRRYELVLLLCLLILAKLAGQKTLSGATEWIRHRAAPISACFGLRRVRMPCQMTYCKVLARLDGHQLDKILSAFFLRWEAQSRCENEPSRLLTPQGHREHADLALDGKTLRATTREVHPVHQLSCYDVITGTVLWHCNVQEKHNEISALKPLLTPQLCKGRILTLDAMHTQRETCALIRRGGGDYVLIAKENQPTLMEDSADLFADRTPDRRLWQTDETWEKGHGRVEHRQIICSPDLNDWFGKRWQGIEQVFRLQRTATLSKTGEVRHQIVSGLSSLSLREAPPQRLLALIHAHWLIENRLHWRRDVTLGEDACQARTRAVPTVLAMLDSTVLSLMDRLGVCNVPRQARFFEAELEQACSLILTGHCSVF